MEHNDTCIDMMIKIAYGSKSVVVIYPEDGQALMTSRPSDDPDTPLIIHRALVSNPDMGNPEHWKSFMYA